MQTKTTRERFKEFHADQFGTKQELMSFAFELRKLSFPGSSYNTFCAGFEEGYKAFKVLLSPQEIYFCSGCREKRRTGEECPCFIAKQHHGKINGVSIADMVEFSFREGINHKPCDDKDQAWQDSNAKKKLQHAIRIPQKCKAFVKKKGEWVMCSKTAEFHTGKEYCFHHRNFKRQPL